MPKLNLNMNELKEENESSCSDSIYTATDVNASTHNEELPNSRSIAKIGSDKSLASSIKVVPLFKDEDNKRKVNNTQVADDQRGDLGDGVDIRAHRAVMKLKEAYKTRNNHAMTMEMLEGENTLE